MGLQVSHGRAHPLLGSRVCPRVVAAGRPDGEMDAPPATTAPWGSATRRHGEPQPSPLPQELDRGGGGHGSSSQAAVGDG
jgi:hypothetical protein